MALPSEADETADPEAADARYDAAVSRLRELTRTNDFPLILKENISYGFRRNLWGRKAHGVAFAALVALSSAVLLVADLLGGAVVPAASAAVPLAFSGLALAVWGVMIKPEWVRDAGESYATRLLESAIRLPPARAD